MPQKLQKRTRILVLCAVVGTALAFRFWGIGWGLHDANISRRPHPDEWVVYWVFQWFNTTHSPNPCPNAATECFFDWGSIYIYLAYAVHAVVSPFLALLPASAFGPHADPVFVHSVLAGRITSALVSTATVLVVYRLGSAAYGVVVGLIAAVLVALSGLLIQLAHFATPDAMTGLLMTSSLLAMFLAGQQPGRSRFALAGLLVGLSVGSEYHMALLLVPLTSAWLLSGSPDGRTLLMSYACAAGGFLVTNPYALFEIGPFLGALEHTVRIRTVDSGAEYQNRFAAYGPAWLYVIRYPLGYGEGFALTIWLVAGAFWAAIRRHKSDLLLLSWIVPYFLLVSWSSAKFMRYSAPLIPPLTILAGALLVQMVQSKSRLTRLGAAVATAVALVFAGTYDAAYAGLFSSPDPRSVATVWLVGHAQPGTRIGFEELPDGVTNLPYFVTAAGYRPCFSEFQPRQLGGPARYLLLDSYVLEEHPQFPAQEVRRFRTALENDSSFEVVERVHYTPTFLGIRFPIDASPHDWRYLTHDITVYQRTKPAPIEPAQCYPNLPSALAALYR